MSARSRPSEEAQEGNDGRNGHQRSVEDGLAEGEFHFAGSNIVDPAQDQDECRNAERASDGGGQAPPFSLEIHNLPDAIYQVRAASPIGGITCMLGSVRW